MANDFNLKVNVLTNVIIGGNPLKFLRRRGLNLFKKNKIPLDFHPIIINMQILPSIFFISHELTVKEYFIFQKIIIIYILTILSCKQLNIYNYNML